MPVHQHRTEAGQHPVDQIFRHGFAVRFRFLFACAEHRAAGAHHVHRVRIRGDRLQCLPHRLRQAAQRFQLGPVGLELGGVRQCAVDQQMRDLLELGLVGEIQDVVAAIVQIVAGAPDRADCGVAGDGARQCDGFFRFG